MFAASVTHVQPASLTIVSWRQVFHVDDAVVGVVVEPFAVVAPSPSAAPASMTQSFSQRLGPAMPAALGEEHGVFAARFLVIVEQ